MERQKSNDRPCCRCSPTRTFSRAVRCGNTADSWKDRTEPRRAKSAGGTAGLQVYATDGREALKLLGKSADLKDDIACDLLFRDRLRAGVLINQNVSS